MKRTDDMPAVVFHSDPFHAVARNLSMRHSTDRHHDTLVSVCG
jgi:hypothetical protein